MFRSRLGERAGRQRVMLAEGHLLLHIHRMPETGNPNRTSAFFWRNPRGEWASTEGGSGRGALSAHFEHWRKFVDDLEDQMQQTPSADTFFSILQSTAPLLRTIRNTHRALQEAREACPDDRAILLARDDAGELERAIELLHHDAKNGMEYMIALLGEEQAERAHQLVAAGHRLNLLIALFLPLTAVGSVFGMNLAHGLEQWQSPWLFWILLTGAVLLGAILMAAVMFLPKARPIARARRKRK